MKKMPMTRPVVVRCVRLENERALRAIPRSMFDTRSVMPRRLLGSDARTREPAMAAPPDAVTKTPSMLALK
jgi:hypothetical protein